MRLRNGAGASVLSIAAFCGFGSAQEWTEQKVIERFLDQSPYTREARARVAIARAEARGRTLYANPSLHYTREGAGLTEFVQAEQSIPISGRRRLLQQAGDSRVRATEAEGAFDIWQARSSLRLAFYEALAGQQRAGIYEAGLKEIEGILQVLRDREREGEGARFDRIRTERERSELLAELALLRAEIQLALARLSWFLPPEAAIPEVSGQIEAAATVLDTSQLVQRALLRRADYRAEQRRVEQYRFEQRAAERLRIPEPVVSAGLKRADVGQRRIANGAVVSVSVPLPVFNQGQAEVARFSAEQQRVSARVELLERQIHAAVEGTLRAFKVRAQARDRYRLELAGGGSELVQIATLAYQEGEIGILQLLDAYRSQRQARLRMIDIQAAVREAQIELERVVGEELGK